MQNSKMDCNHKFVTVNVEIESASEIIDIEVCNICCFTKAEIELEQSQARERVVREALEKISRRVLTPENNADTVIYVTNLAREALKQEGKS